MHMFCESSSEKDLCQSHVPSHQYKGSTAWKHYCLNCPILNLKPFHPYDTQDTAAAVASALCIQNGRRKGAKRKKERKEDSEPGRILNFFPDKIEQVLGGGRYGSRWWWRRRRDFAAIQKMGEVFLPRLPELERQNGWIFKQLLDARSSMCVHWSCRKLELEDRDWCKKGFPQFYQGNIFLLFFNFWTTKNIFNLSG